MSEYKTPLGIKIISVLHYIIAVLYFVFGLVSVIFPKNIATTIAIQNNLDYSMIGTISIAIIIFSVVLMWGMAVLEFLIARGLWGGKRWTRVLVTVFAAINIIFTIAMLFLTHVKTINTISRYVVILVSLIIIGYLFFNKKAKEFFKKDKKY
jgi:hypothetical protein